MIKASTRAQPFFNIRQSVSVTNRVSVIWARKVLSSALPMHQKPHKCLDRTRSYNTIKNVCTCQRTQSRTPGKSQTFPQSSDFSGDQRVLLWEVENWFAHRATLAKHVISHSSEKPYKCPEFGKTFSPKLISYHPQGESYR